MESKLQGILGKVVFSFQALVLEGTLRGVGVEMMSNVNRESPISCAAAMGRHGDGGHGEPLVYRHSS